tara:strand:+ start:97 stop:408 length:312 start_codon:yes stop_codon:yes gene_type:complete
MPGIPNTDYHMALNGSGVIEIWSNHFWMMAFFLLPFIALCHWDYVSQKHPVALTLGYLRLSKGRKKTDIPPSRVYPKAVFLLCVPAGNSKKAPSEEAAIPAQS